MTPLEKVVDAAAADVAADLRVVERRLSADSHEEIRESLLILYMGAKTSRLVSDR